MLTDLIPLTSYGVLRQIHHEQISRCDLLWVRHVLRLQALLAVDPPVETSDQTLHRDVKYLTNAERGSHRDRSSGFDLLPVTRREAKQNHILLAITSRSTKLPDSVS